MRMRWMLAVTIAACAASPASAQSSASMYPWCAGMQMDQGQSISCRFGTFEECRQETTGGMRGWCFRNPRYVASAPEPEPPPEQPPPRRRR